VSKQPIIYSGVFDPGFMTYFSARPFGYDDGSGPHRIAGWHNGHGGRTSCKSVFGCDFQCTKRTLADDGEAIEWLLAGEKGGAR